MHTLKVYKKDIVITMLSVAGIVFFVFITNPKTLPVFMLLLLPVLVALAFKSLSRLILKVFSQITDERINILSSSLAVVLLFMFALGSLGQLEFKDSALIILFSSGFSFYFYRLRQPA